MSFLNPVNEPVLRFKSTDAGAPQINYNARVAGDVKAVLKACLVDGYGVTASAGWTITNEVNHVAEFVSPSAAMSDYRLGIDDTSASSTTWYYQYQGERVNPKYNSPTKNFSTVDKAHVDNGWQLLVTDNGFYLIEHLQHSSLQRLSSRLTYFGQVKLALSDTSRNISFFQVGHDGSYLYTKNFFNTSSYTYIDVATTTSGLAYFGPIICNTAGFNTFANGSNIESMSELYIYGGLDFVGQQPGVIVKQALSIDAMYGVTEVDLDGRPCLEITLGMRNESAATNFGVVALLRLDNWGY